MSRENDAPSKVKERRSSIKHHSKVGVPFHAGFPISHRRKSGDEELIASGTESIFERVIELWHVPGAVCEKDDRLGRVYGIYGLLCSVLSRYGSVEQKKLVRRLEVLGQCCHRYSLIAKRRRVKNEIAMHDEPTV